MICCFSAGRAALNKRIPRKGIDSGGFCVLRHRDVMDAFEKDLIEVILNRYPNRNQSHAGPGSEPPLHFI